MDRTRNLHDQYVINNYLLDRLKRKSRYQRKFERADIGTAMFCGFCVGVVTGGVFFLWLAEVIRG